MAVEGPPVSELAGLMTELAEAYTIGGLTAAVGIQGGADLQRESIDLLAEVTWRYGLLINPIQASFPAESGLAQAAAKFVAAARDWLRAGGRAALKTFSKQPGAVITAGAVAGSLGIVYTWLTADERVELQRLRENSELLRRSFNGLRPEDRHKAIGLLAGNLGARTSTTTALLWGLGIFAGIIGVRWFLARETD